MRKKTFLDDGRDGATIEMSTRSRESRLFVTLVVGVLLYLTFGATPAALWTTACGAYEVWAVYRHRLFRQGHLPQRPRLTRLAAIAYLSTIWSVTAAGCWAFGPAPMKFAAMIILFGLLIEAIKYGATSGLAFAALAPSPFIALAVAPMLFGGYAGWELAVIAVALLGLGVYVFDAARIVRQNAKALEEARAEALQASQAKSAFLAMMSHELRTPMNGVLGMAHALATTDLDRRQADYLDMIVQSGDGLMAILNDILDLSKIEAGKLELEAVSFDIGKIGRQIYLLWGETARQKGVDLTLDIAHDAPTWLIGDPTRVRQVLLNLVSNALKFTEAGAVSIRIAERPEGGVVIAVSDTGVGMSQDQQGKLFQTFSQGESSTTRRFGGTGLGLAICRRLTDLMGGEIAVTSAPGEGTTFTVSLPLPAAPSPRSAEAEAAPINLDGRRLLVVDDNAVNRTVARAILEAAGATVTLAAEGEEALALHRTEAFDVILMDVHMPVMDGIEALNRIRAGEAGPADVHIIALTADAMSGQDQRLIAMGFDGAHPKPFRPVDLMRAVAGGCPSSEVSPSPSGEISRAEASPRKSVRTG